MKKYISLLMIAILLLICMIPVNAAYETREQALAPFLVCQKGDIDGDGRITTADARLCLRVVVGLEELNKIQLQAADVTGNGVVAISCARKILRASVGLEQLNSDRVRTSSDAVILKPLLTAGSGMYQWECTVVQGAEFAEVQRSSYEISAPDTDGGPVEQVFSILLRKQGTFVFAFELKCAWSGEVLRQYTLTVDKT